MLVVSSMYLSESDTRVKLIDPKIKESDWNESNIVREYFFTDGRKQIPVGWIKQSITQKTYKGYKLCLEY